MCSPRVLPIAPCFNLICFAQCPPLLTKGGGTPSFNRIFYFGGASTEPTFFCNGPIKITHCNKKVGLMKHPQLININHTKRQQAGHRAQGFLILSMGFFIPSTRYGLCGSKACLQKLKYKNIQVLSHTILS